MAVPEVRGTLLIIEKDPRFVEKFKKHLNVDGLKPVFFESGQAAMAHLQKAQTSFLLINLNGIRSWEDINGLMDYAKTHQVPYLFVEGLRKTQAVAERLRKKGYQAFIKLPFSIKVLIRQIKVMLDRDVLLGRTIGPEGHKVALTAKLGKGATGVVYQARQPSLDRHVAVKFMVDTLINDDEAVQRFHQEARAIAQMRSPHIVQIYFVAVHEQRPYIVMEYIQGPTLEKYLRSKGRLKSTRALQITREVLLGLIEAHSHDRVHRDLKPANIMLNQRGQALILDFGLVRESKGNLTQQGMVLGTPRYISPEQVNGKSIDLRCDLYSLGIMLYEMLVGEVPFQGKYFMSILWKHVKEPLPTRTSLDVVIEPDVWQLIERLTHKNPDDRFQTAGAALKAVEACIAGMDLERAGLPQREKIGVLEKLKATGGATINEAGTVHRQIGTMSAEHTQALKLVHGLLGQFQNVEQLGSFHRGLVHLDDSKLMVFNCFDELGALESNETDISTRFNMMDIDSLARVFKSGVGSDD